MKEAVQEMVPVKAVNLIFVVLLASCSGNNTRTVI